MSNQWKVYGTNGKQKERKLNGEVKGVRVTETSFTMTSLFPKVL